MRCSQIAALVLAAGLGYLAGASRKPLDQVLEADRAFDRETAAGGAEAWANWFAEDGRMIRSDGQVVAGRAAIRALMAPLLESPGNSLRWQPEFGEAARSGELAYTVGASKLRMRDSQGRLIERDGRYVTIWKKQTGGAWRVVLDIGSGGPPRPVTMP